jgi:hypothetical protein
MRAGYNPKEREIQIFLNLEEYGHLCNAIKGAGLKFSRMFHGLMNLI